MSSTFSSGDPSGKVRGKSDQFMAAEDSGLQKGLGARQLQMIAIGGAIGTGLFLGAGGRLASAGPSLFIIYGVCGFFGYLMLRSLGELVCHRPSSGSFVSYTREFYGEKAAYVSGWLYWLNWAMTAIADATAIAIYVRWFGRYSEVIASIPQWVSALAVVGIVVGANLISVKVFGEMEFWFSLIKVGTLVLFLVLGIIFVVFGSPTGQPTGISLITDHGGLFPSGGMAALVVIQGVVFAYAGIELVGTTSGETKNPEKVIPRAINTVILRIAVFYVGSVLLLCMLMPYTAYSESESPFVTFFSSIGVDVAGPIVQLVVVTAALSSLNAGLYSTGRILHSMAMAGSAPRFAAKLNASGVPFGGILLTAVVSLLGVVLNYLVPSQAFEIVLNISAIGTMASWAAVTLSHEKFVRLAKQGLYTRPAYRAPFVPITNWLTVAFLVTVVVLMALDYPVGTLTLGSMLIVIPLLGLGWFFVRERVMELAAQREGITGAYPIVAARRAVDARHRHEAQKARTVIAPGIYTENADNKE
ncbi:amino acid permease [Rothia uropygialis]|uniref:amino acid permease n=1 Tax=Kocuria sp. 36 TaxID=1415402 RepID=UPI00101E0D60